MFKTIDEALDWIMAQRNENSTFEHFKQIMESIGNPQNDFYTIHVAGTNGKGSTVSYLRDLLISQGFKVGTLQSPHYISHLDRIRVNGINIPAETFLRIINNRLKFFKDNYLSMFEMDYIIMYDFFKEENIDVAVVEVGLGGRLDSTNVIDNTKLSIITTIGYDHMDRLGNTLELICKEKCGIIKDNSKVLIGDLPKQCRDIVIEEANKHNSEFFDTPIYDDLGDRRFKYNNEEYELESYATYQLHNASLALKAFEIVSKDYSFEMDLDKAKKALSKTIWENRFQIVKDNPRVILDGGHNVPGIEALVKSFDQFSGSKCIIFSALKRKEYKKMLDILIDHTDKLVITAFNNHEEILDLNEFENTKFELNPDYIEAIDKAISEYDNILICGSLYFLSDVVLNYNFK